MDDIEEPEGVEEDEWSTVEEVPVKRFDWRVIPAASLALASDLSNSFAKFFGDLGLTVCADVNYRTVKDQSRDLAGEVLADINNL